MELSKAQHQIVNRTNRVTQVIAAAGSGKTGTVVQLIRGRVESGQIDPRKILVLSFSRKACAEIRHRLGAHAKSVQVSTFHSLAYRAMKESWNGRILTDTERMSFLRRFLSQRDTQGVPYQVLMANKRLFRSHMPALCMDTYRALAIYKRERDMLEFDDLATGMLRMLRAGGLGHLRFGYDLVIVDEFQDTDPQQLEFLRHIRFKQLFVVGDDYQSIYSFRGADPSIFLGFQKHFKDAARSYLVENFRSLRPITDLGNGVIRHARHRLKKRVVSMRGEGGIKSCAHSVEPGDEAKIASIISTVPDARILCRSNHRLIVWNRAGMNKEQLSTIHSAKGLEFPIVFLDLIGGWSSIAQKKRMPDEEVRISYVGLTRAQNLLVVLHSEYGPNDPERLAFEMFRARVQSAGASQISEIVHRAASIHSS